MVNSLKSCKLENMIIGNDEISGKIEAEQKKLLCMAIPYSKGWDAYVDNEKCELLKVNKRYIGVMIDKGSHEVRFKYHTPYQKAGLAVSCIGIVLLLVYSTLLKFRHI